MKLKTFFADSIPEAMSEIRRVFGEKAVIVSSFRTKGKGVKLVVATEEAEQSGSLIRDEYHKNEQRRRYFKKILASRQVSDEMIERLVNALARKGSKISEEKFLSRAIAELYSFKSLEPIKRSGLFAFVGASGCGKTTAVAKLAFHAKTQKIQTALITLDTQKVGGADELMRYAHIMEMPCTVLDDWHKLNETITVLRLNYGLILIDTPALNPYNTEDAGRLNVIKTQVADADMIYVQQAGMDCHEAQTQGAVFSKGGCLRLLVTKTDASASYGGFLQSAAFSAFQFAGFSKSGKVTDYLTEATPDNLAQLLKHGSGEGEEE